MPNIKPPIPHKFLWAYGCSRGSYGLYGVYRLILPDHRYVPEFNFGTQVPKYCHGTQSVSLHGFTSWRRSKGWLHLLCMV